VHVRAGDAVGELIHVRLPDDDDACFEQTLHDGRVAARRGSIESGSSARGLAPPRDVVLDDDGHAGKDRASAGTDAGRDSLGLLPGALRIELSQGIEAGAGLGALQGHPARILGAEGAG
jgi:hypothetical protein